MWMTSARNDDVFVCGYGNVLTIIISWVLLLYNRFSLQYDWLCWLFSPEGLFFSKAGASQRTQLWISKGFNLLIAGLREINARRS
jgi:hypothetical protein